MEEARIVLKQKLDFDEYLRYDDGSDNKYELYEGELVVVPLPLSEHALILLALEDMLKALCSERDWRVFRGDVGVRIRPRRSRIPDITVLDPALLPMGQEAVVEDPPALVIEVVSESTRGTDLGIKRSEYATVEVPEYWIVDMARGEFRVLQLANGVYLEAVYLGNQAVPSPTFGTLPLTPEALWQRARVTDHGTERDVGSAR